MLRWTLFIFSLVLALLSLLTAVKTPDFINWKFALLAQEYGHFLALAPLAIAVFAWRLRDHPPAAALATLALCALALALFLKPAVQARSLARTLPAQLERAFGPAVMRRPAFSFSALFDHDPAPVPVATFNYSGGQELDFYRATSAAPSPCVIVVHGGGWNSGDRGEIRKFDDWLAGHGYAVAAISYRLAPDSIWPAQRDDVLAAVKYIKDHAAALGVDPLSLFLFGRSAGGQIAEATAYAARDPAILGVAAFYAPADMHFAYEWGREDDILKSPKLLREFLGGTPATARSAYDSASGILLVTPATTPTLLVHGELDTLVWHRQSTRLDARLAAAGVPHLFLSLPWATHAVEFNLHGPGGQLATYALEWFFISRSAAATGPRRRE